MSFDDSAIVCDRKGSAKQFLDENFQTIPDCKLEKDFHYLILGHGDDKSEEKFCMLRTDSNENFGVPVERLVEIRWSAQRLSVVFLPSCLQVQLPPYTDVIGYASSFKCFPNDHMGCIRVYNGRAVILGGKRYLNVQGILYPKKYVSSPCKIVCRKITIDSNILLPKRLISTGVALTTSCNQENESIRFVLNPSSKYYIKEYDSNFIVHSPVFVDELPPFISEVLVIKQRAIGIFVKLSALIGFILPGVIQYFGSDEKSWGDVANQMIGTGSVFVTVILFAFEKLFGVSIFSRRTFDCLYSVKSNAAVRLFAQENLKHIETLACDPRMPLGLICDYKNSASRSASKSGWLRAGQSIHVSKMKEHGYIVIFSHGLVLDRFSARYLKCSRINEKGNKVILNRKGRRVSSLRCSVLRKDDVFE